MFQTKVVGFEEGSHKRYHWMTLRSVTKVRSLWIF